MTNKLGIIGGSGLYDVEEFKERELINCSTPWGSPSDQILKTIYKNRIPKGNFNQRFDVKLFWFNGSIYIDNS